MSAYRPAASSVASAVSNINSLLQQLDKVEQREQVGVGIATTGKAAASPLAQPVLQQPAMGLNPVLAYQRLQRQK